VFFMAMAILRVEKAGKTDAKCTLMYKVRNDARTYLVSLLVYLTEHSFPTKILKAYISKFALPSVLFQNSSCQPTV
jgi:hypothetical protein